MVAVLQMMTIFHKVVWFFRVFLKFDPLCEIQAKVSTSNYEKTSIKDWFQSLISL